MPVMKSLASMVMLCRRCWILSRIFLKFMQFVLADECVVFVTAIFGFPFVIS